MYHVNLWSPYPVLNKRCEQKKSLALKPDSANWVVFQPNVIIDAKLGKKCH